MDKDIHTLAIIQKLVESTIDKNDIVVNAVKASLYQIASKFPNEILKSICDYYKKNKLISVHITILFDVIVHICREHILKLDGDTVLMLIEFCVDEMTKSSLMHSTELEIKSSDILVALGERHCIQVMDGVLKKFETGKIPHYTILHTMGSLAFTNHYGTVPFVKNIIVNLVSIISLFKADYLKQAFAYAVGNFSYAISEYIANIEKAPDPTIEKEHFETELITINDLFLTSWLHSKEANVVDATLQAMSTVIIILPKKKIIELIPKLIPTLLGLYRKSKEPCLITKCLCSTLYNIPTSDVHLIEGYFDNIVQNLLEQLCISPDYAQPESLKNHSEALRCFDIIATYFPDKLIDYLTQHLKTNNEATKLKALIVISHLMNTSDNILKSKLFKFLMSLKLMLTEQSLKIKKILLKIIVLLAYHDLISGEDLNTFLLFIIKLCCLHPEKDKSQSDNFEKLEFKRVCDNSLYLLTSTVVKLEKQLWSFYLQIFMSVEYTDASCSVLKCLSYLASKQTEEQFELMDKSEAINCTAVFVRCLALLSSPLTHNQGLYVLNFLKSYSVIINKKIVLLWDKLVNDTIKYLEDTNENLNNKQWENQIVQFLTFTINEIDDQNWVKELTAEFEHNINSYTEFTPEKGFLLLCLAATIIHLDDKKIVDNQLNSMLYLVLSQNENEIMICSKMITICAKMNLIEILNKLQIIWRNECSKKSTKFFGFMKDSKHDYIEKIRHTFINCYHEIALSNIPNTVENFIDFNILIWVVEQLKETKDTNVCLCALGCISQIANIMHPKRNKSNKSHTADEKNHVLFSVIELLQDVIKPQHHSSVLQTATALIKLPPLLTQSQKTKIFKTCFENIYNAFSVDGKLKTQILIDEINYNLTLLIKEILLQSVSPVMLEEIFCLLEMWLIEKNTEQRYSAIKMLKSVFNCYLDNISYDTATAFELTGFIVGCLIPRCFDPNLLIRVEGIDCVRLVLTISCKYSGQIESNDKLLPITNTIQRLMQSSETMQEANEELCKMISENLPHYQMMNFIESLLNGLMDVENTSARGVSETLNMFSIIKGRDLFHYIEDIVCKIIIIIDKISDEDVKNQTLKTIASLATHHPKAVIVALLMQPLGYQSCIPDCWKIISENNELASITLSQFIHLISGTAVYDEQNNRDRIRIAIHQPLAAISALNDMFSWTHMKNLAVAQFPELFCLLYVSIATYVGVLAPVNIIQSKEKEKIGLIANRNAYKLNTLKIVFDTFNAFLQCTDCDKVAEVLLSCTKIENQENITFYMNVIPAIVENICSTVPHSVPKIITNLANYRSSVYESQRIVVIAFYSEFIRINTNHHNIVLLETIVSSLLEGQTDSCAVIRELSLKGLGYLPYYGEPVTSRYCSTVLSAFMNGLDDNKISENAVVNIPLQALNGLSSVMSTLDDEQLTNIQMNIGMRIKPFFENDNAVLRTAAIRLFGIFISTSKHLPNQQIMKDQINGNLICLLLHLSDKNEDVVKACKYTMKEIVPVLEATNVNSLIQNHLIDEARLHYFDFMTILIKNMAEELPEMISFLMMNALTYLKSWCPEIRGNTALLIGLLYNNLPNGAETQKSLDIVYLRLSQLLKDPEPAVRAKAATAFSKLLDC